MVGWIGDSCWLPWMLSWWRRSTLRAAERGKINTNMLPPEVAMGTNVWWGDVAFGAAGEMGNDWSGWLRLVFC